MTHTSLTRPFPLPGAVGALAFALLPAGPARAATIVWDAPMIISASTNVSTGGSLLYAYNFGATGVNPVLGDVLLNGVNFERFALPLLSDDIFSVTVGSVTLDVGGGSKFYSTSELTGASSGSFSILVPAYQELLQSGVATSGFNGTLALTMGGLTNGQQYSVQFWTNNSGSLLTFTTAGTTYTAGNSVTLDDNQTGDIGGVGRWVTGTFTADGSTQLVTLQSSTPESDFPVINAFQVRQIPEPTAPLLLLCGAALLRRRRARG